MNAETILAWTKVILSGAATLVLVPLAYYFVRYYWDRRRWHTFERLIRQWAAEEYFGKEMTDEDLALAGRDQA